MYVQTSVKKKEAAKSPFKTDANGGVHDMKETHMPDETTPAASSPLREKKCTAMGKLVKKWLSCAPFTTWIPRT